MGNLLWSSDRPDFVERVAKLAGQTTYRVPVGGRSTSSDHLPDAHAIASALAFARRGPEDIGPDVAYCWVLRSNAYRNKVVGALARSVGNGISKRTQDDIFVAADSAWMSFVWGKEPKRPSNIDQPAWEYANKLFMNVLHAKAWDALAEAERRYTRNCA